MERGNNVLCLIKSSRSGVNVSTSEVKLAMAYKMVGLHGATVITSGSIDQSLLQPSYGGCGSYSQHFNISR